MAILPAVSLADREGRGRKNNPVRNVPITGTATDGQTFTGSFDIERFEAVGNSLLAVGQLNGKFSGGKPVNHQSVAIPVQSITSSAGGGFGGDSESSLQRPGSTTPATWDPSRGPLIIPAQAACDILTLALGPLHLDLLGLVVDLAPVNLDITAVPGAGNLLGNLLCAVAGLLDPGGIGGALGQIAGLLSQIVNILNGLV